MPSIFMLLEKIGGGGFVCNRSATIILDKETTVFIPQEVTNLCDGYDGHQQVAGVTSRGHRVVTYHDSRTSTGIAQYGNMVTNNGMYAAFLRLPGTASQASAEISPDNTGIAAA